MSTEGIGVTAPANTKVILIVDDDHEVGEVLQRIILQQTDYQVVWMAESEAVLKAAPSLHPSLILLDYMLPAMHGLELYDRLQEVGNMRGVPVILISARDTVPFEALRERGIYLLKKPFELTDLLDMLAQLLSN